MDKQGQRFIDAIEDRNLKELAAIVDLLRFKRGMRYQEIAELANNLTGIEPGDWEALMQDVDTFSERDDT